MPMRRTVGNVANKLVALTTIALPFTMTTDAGASTFNALRLHPTMDADAVTPTFGASYLHPTMDADGDTPALDT